MAWIKLRSDLERNGHLMSVARSLGVGRMRILGALYIAATLFQVWYRNGWAPHYHPSHLDDDVSLPGFAEELRRVGLIEVNGSGWARLVGVADIAPNHKGTTGYVYFAQCVSTSLVKIGYTRDPDRRMQELKTASPGGVTLLAYYRGGRSDEKALHDRFADLRRHGEWFEPTLEMDTIIRGGLP